jgi:YfiR/HmsC-like
VATKPRRLPAALASAHRGCIALMAGLVPLAATVLSLQSAQAASSAENEIKAAFMYNFAKFVRWPAASFADPQAPLLVCALGEDGLGPALDTIDHKVAQGHELRVRHRIRLEDARSCHILFVAASERGRLPAILHALTGASVLTVSDIDGFAESGGIIGLYDVDNKLQFSINAEQARAASLQINAQLLKLARIVGHETRQDAP